jgi:hypothetical protein
MVPLPPLLPPPPHDICSRRNASRTLHAAYAMPRKRHSSFRIRGSGKLSVVGGSLSVADRRGRGRSPGARAPSKPAKDACQRASECRPPTADCIRSVVFLRNARSSSTNPTNMASVAGGNVIRTRKRGSAKAEAAVVESVSIEVAAFVPGVRLAGENEHVARAGRLEQPSVMALGKAPNCGATVTL